MGKIRLSLWVAAIAALVCVGGCTSVRYRNAQQCKQKMVQTYPGSMPKLRYAKAAVSGDSSRVVVEGTYKTPNKSPPPTLLKAKSVDNVVGVECMFDGEALRTFRWLSPEKLAKQNSTTE